MNLPSGDLTQIISNCTHNIGLSHNVFVSGLVKMTKIMKIPKIMATISLRYPESILIQELKNHTPRL